MVWIEQKRAEILKCEPHRSDRFATRCKIAWWIPSLALSLTGPQSKISLPDIAPGINSYRSAAAHARSFCTCYWGLYILLKLLCLCSSPTMTPGTMIVWTRDMPVSTRIPSFLQLPFITWKDLRCISKEQHQQGSFNSSECSLDQTREDHHLHHFAVLDACRVGIPHKDELGDWLNRVKLKAQS